MEILLLQHFFPVRQRNLCTTCVAKTFLELRIKQLRTTRKTRVPTVSQEINKRRGIKRKRTRNLLRVGGTTDQLNDIVVNLVVLIFSLATHSPFTAPLEPANARSMVLSSPFVSCFVTKSHDGTATGDTQVRRSQFQTGALTPRSTATESDLGDEHSGEEEALPYRCDGCLGSLYVLPLRGLTECSLCDELYTDLAWCVWCRSFTCPDCVRIMARLPACDSSDGSAVSD